MKTRQLLRSNERDFRNHPPIHNRLQRTISSGNISEAAATPTTNESERMESDTSAAIGQRGGPGHSGRLTPLESLLLAAPAESAESHDKDISSPEHMEVGLQSQSGGRDTEGSTKTVTLETANIDTGGNTNANNNDTTGKPDGSGSKAGQEKESGSSSSSSSSSSDSDNEDSSSSGSSGIDDSLFEQLGEGEGQGEGEGEGEELRQQKRQAVDWDSTAEQQKEESCETGTKILRFGSVFKSGHAVPHTWT